jgi:transposase
MVRPCKLTPEIQQRISDNIALGLTYSLAASSAGITYKTFNIWLNKGKTEKSGKYYQFYKYIIKCNADGALKLLERLNEAAKGVNCQVCMFILERRFPDEFGRRVNRKTNVVSENLNPNVEIIINDTDGIRKQILAKFDRVGENNESLTS